jgi:hypothetical protein
MTEPRKPAAKLMQALAMKALASVARGTEITVDGERMDAARLGARADRELVEAGVELTQELIARGAAAVEARATAAAARSSGSGRRFSDPRSSRRGSRGKRPRDRE